MESQLRAGLCGLFLFVTLFTSCDGHHRKYCHNEHDSLKGRVQQLESYMSNINDSIGNYVNEVLKELVKEGNTQNPHNQSPQDATVQQLQAELSDAIQRIAALERKVADHKPIHEPPEGDNAAYTPLAPDSGHPAQFPDQNQPSDNNNPHQK